MASRHSHDQNWIDRFTALITALAATFGREADEPMFEGFLLGLDDLPIEAIEAGVRRAMRESKFWPTVAVLRELSGVMTPEQRANIAWSAVCEAIRRVGYYRSPEFDDPLVTAAIHSVFPAGWMALCDAAADGGKDWDAHTRREFIASYVRLMNGGATKLLVRPLIGFYERENATNGHAIPPRVKVATGLPGHARPILVDAGQERPRLSATKALLRGVE